MENTFVFIDGAYLSIIARHLFDGHYPPYNINQLGITLAKRQGLWVKETFYYNAPPYQSPKPTTEEKERRAKYDRFTYNLRKIPNFTVKEGRCQKTDGGFNQKAVDTLLIMGLMRIASRGDVRKIVLLACDTDFVPIIEEIQREWKIKVILCYYSDFVRNSKFSMSNYIINACHNCVLIKKSDFEKCLLH